MARPKGSGGKEAFIPKTRVEAWRRKAYEAAARAERLRLSAWLRRALDRAAGVESVQPYPEAQGEGWADIGD